MQKTEGYTYIDSQEGLNRLVDLIQPVSRLAFDTEADSLHSYFDKVCLIQLSFGPHHCVLDPLAPGLNFTRFFEILTDKELILQGADYDLRMLKKTFGFRPKAPVFDTMLAAQVLGYERFGLAALVEKFFGVVLSKSGQKSDWSRRPLTPKLLTYASDDTRYLESIADTLIKEMTALNRLDWHRQCCERAVQVSGQPSKASARDPWRIKGTSKLPPKVLAYVRELWHWRDEEAQQRDRPPFMILLNDDLISLALWLLENPSTPFSEGPVYLKRMKPERLERLQKAVERAKLLPSSEWPEPPSKGEWPKNFVSHDGKLEPLLDAARKTAQALKIDSGFLAPKSALTVIAQQRPKSVDEIVQGGQLMRWQAEVLWPSIQAVLKI